jgi:hypothetical protein
VDAIGPRRRSIGKMASRSARKRLMQNPPKNEQDRDAASEQIGIYYG